MRNTALKRTHTPFPRRMNPTSECQVCFQTTDRPRCAESATKKTIITNVVTMAFFNQMLSISMTEISISWESSHYRDPAGFRPRVLRNLSGSPQVFSSGRPPLNAITGTQCREARRRDGARTKSQRCWPLSERY